MMGDRYLFQQAHLPGIQFVDRTHDLDALLVQCLRDHWMCLPQALRVVPDVGLDRVIQQVGRSLLGIMVGASL